MFWKRREISEKMRQNVISFAIWFIILAKKSIKKLAHGHVFDIGVKLSTVHSTRRLDFEVRVISFDKDRVYEDHLHVIRVWSFCIVETES